MSIENAPAEKKEQSVRHRWEQTLRCQGVGLTGFAVLMYFATYASGDGTRIFPGDAKAAKDLGCSERTVRTWRQWAIDQGWFAVVAVADAGKGLATEMRLSIPAGTPEPDAPTPESVAGTPESVAGTPESDAAIPERDSGEYRKEIPPISTYINPSTRPSTNPWEQTSDQPIEDPWELAARSLADQEIGDDIAKDVAPMLGPDDAPSFFDDDDIADDAELAPVGAAEVDGYVPSFSRRTAPLRGASIARANR